MEDLNLNEEKLRNYFSGKYSEEDSACVEKLFRNKKLEKELKEFLYKEWDKSLAVATMPENNLDYIFHRLYSDIQNERNTKGKNVRYAKWQ